MAAGKSLKVVEGNDVGDDDAQDDDDDDASKSQFEQRSCFSSTCEAFVRVLKAGAAGLALLNCVLDILYAYKTIYVLQTIFIITCVLLGIRLLMVLAVGQYYYTVYVSNHKADLSKTVEKKGADDDEVDHDERGKSMTNRSDAAIAQQGRRLYSSMYVLLYTGFYRILPARDFNYPLAIGYSLECFTSIVPMFFC